MDRNSVVLKAKLAQQAERFDDMFSHMKEVARQSQKLTVEERRLFCVACSKVVNSRRASPVPVIMDLKIMNELYYICNEILSIIEKSLLPKSTSGEDKVFYCKMKGDHHRYLCEFQTGDTCNASASAALDAYLTATVIASSDLSRSHPIRLRLANNLAVFYNEIHHRPDRAYRIGKQAFDDASASAKSKSGTLSKESRTEMQLLKRNLKTWTSSQTGNVQKKKFNKMFAMKLGWTVMQVGLDVAGIPCPDCPDF
mmetsp:Transcript_13824/g.21371  ORF Transcript_13824/g.21371 Transcript_13824/m.21371 type:complete len:254 (-) Transcript_13824:176-937(-)|eukprot:CAMPEP_0201715718 /NCGR_PEP_ID=MMETSP0593-20130828/1838_1 /ASSEMBLY_ACC=CAM_ASM_000672 /TAXON_ID=267983 /ORGANISM="Skeletonema japonicum, Strain CCMP2506" /LENGTH=253 /DNA_ID=CAMNT_0048205297 /DNA_START=49 /DNA_END=810 /DNA_ORIENTATION=-